MELWGRFKAFIEKDVRFQNEPKRIFLLLRSLYLTFAVYFLAVIFLEAVVFRWGLPVTSLCLLLCLVPAFALTYRYPARRNVAVFFALIIVWVAAFLLDFGWSCGIQHFLFGLVALYFFAGDGKTWKRAAVTAALFLLRLALFVFCQGHTPAVALSTSEMTVLQTLNSAVTFLVIAMVCGFYASSIDSAEKKLIRYNEELKKEAATDPLTGLMNRRSMMEGLNAEIGGRHCFTVALGDIDFFKNVNDRWGHNEGDAVLAEMAELFMREMQGKGTVCRWGGEEFLFFFPGRNGDEAKEVVMRLHEKVQRMEFGEKAHFHLTMTFGIEEYDFHETLTELVSKVDQKLYAGKEQGRNRIVY